MNNFFKKLFRKNETRPERDGFFYSKIREILGFEPISLKHYEYAFVHRSTQKTDEQGNPISYERLEFLGDSILSTIIAAHLFTEVPHGNEGYLTKMRSKIVSREHLNELGRDLNLIMFVESKAPNKHFGDNIHGNLFEALVGAIYLDRGFEYCKKFIHDRVIVPYVDIPRLEGKVTSYKSLIIEWCQKERYSFYYKTYEDNGNEQQKYFAVKLSVNDEVVAKARATSKKKAEEIASKRAYFAFQEKIKAQE